MPGRIHTGWRPLIKNWSTSATCDWWMQDTLYSYVYTHPCMLIGRIYGQRYPSPFITGDTTPHSTPPKAPPMNLNSTNIAAVNKLQCNNRINSGSMEELEMKYKNEEKKKGGWIGNWFSSDVDVARDIKLVLNEICWIRPVKVQNCPNIAV